MNNRKNVIKFRGGSLSELMTDLSLLPGQRVGSYQVKCLHPTIFGHLVNPNEMPPLHTGTEGAIKVGSLGKQL